jgi:hypothetical protein
LLRGEGFALQRLLPLKTHPAPTPARRRGLENLTNLKICFMNWFLIGPGSGASLRPAAFQTLAAGKRHAGFAAAKPIL